MKVHYQSWRYGVLVQDVEIEEPDVPLDPPGVLATLLAVLGVVSVEDAANAVGLTPEALVAEAEAWAVAGS